MLWVFHFVMFVLFVVFGVSASSAVDDGSWGAAVVWGGLTVLVVGTEILVLKVLPWFLGRDPYDDWRDAKDGA